ncbi:hypothetical protein BDN71DRAFT_1437170 [Pleurotus eryngii]|uniref:Uncharacterized protein n=1 Tax=Pleurotus eryngii TaxID=5323 RepID=A0A9P5ZJH5_PLEER|nr:hypothetical protein BDN71DRAFT_1437170 [Pleurotus eryngii]
MNAGVIAIVNVGQLQMQTDQCATSSSNHSGHHFSTIARFEHVATWKDRPLAKNHPSLRHFFKKTCIHRHSHSHLQAFAVALAHAFAFSSIMQVQMQIQVFAGALTINEMDMNANTYDYILEEHTVSTCSRNSKESGGNNYIRNTGGLGSRVYAWPESIAKMHVNVPLGASWMRP